MKEKVIANIKTIRESKNLKAEYLAGQLGISQPAYSKKETGENDFTLPELIKLSDVLEVPLVKIIDLDLARVIQQQHFYDQSSATGVVEHQTLSAEGYLVAIENQKQEIAYLREQLAKLMEKLGG
jgi:transcriptional regulator with XRE-family HTH domain